MSAQQTFAFCIDCWELHYGIPDKNGVYSRDSGSSNHYDHAVHVFGRPVDYPAPIRQVLTKLHAGLPVTDAEITLFSLGLALEPIQSDASGPKPNGKSVTENRATLSESQKAGMLL